MSCSTARFEFQLNASRHVPYGAQTWPRLTLLVKSQTHGRAVLHTMCEGRRHRIHSTGDTHSPGVEDEPLRLNHQSHVCLDIA
jgi:hypothetical protein